MKAKTPHLALFGEETGSATVEYLVLSIFVTITASAALAALGPPLLRLFRAQVIWLALPIH